MELPSDIAYLDVEVPGAPLGEPAVDLAGLAVPFRAGWRLPGMGWSGTGCLNAVAWLLRQPEDAVTVQELVDLYAAPAGS